MNCRQAYIPLLASPPRSASAAARSLKRCWVAASSNKFRVATAADADGVVFLSASVGKPRRHLLTLGAGRGMFRIFFLIALPLLLAVMQGGEWAAQDKPLLAEQVFKNVQALRGIPVDDFIQTMGLMTAALQFDCSDCHVGAGTNRVDWGDDSPRKVMARQMVNMVATINKTNFGGRQMVTCWT